MKRTGIIHAELARRIAGLRHTDTFVICDAGLPLAPTTPCIDLGYRYGQASFSDVTTAVLSEVVVEHSWVSRDVLTVSPHVHRHLEDVGLTPEPIEHELFKAQVLDVAFAVRTGEDTFYANVLCRAGVAFG
ncbi:D-ribose pyranase [Mycolicibacterium sp. J2]|jgi:D-ribose pyranase|uniref:D-ribose pyranase n=1 Tax=Mycolicibacterium sp. J2 TaxID=2993511 RepID=UPI00224A5F1D|nr:D-ribose pyranase [Mycolicibacterium sp. J2]MCX2713179.1 D-ribose pyranase [Mycolicibacterium sp. J2]